MTTNQRDESAGISDSRFNQDIYSRVIRAGKRTYFFDVKCTRSDEYYLTITESKRRFEDNGQPVFEKHKIFLYREDFDKFISSLQEIFTFIQEQQPLSGESESSEDEMDTSDGTSFVDIEFEDLTN